MAFLSPSFRHNTGSAETQPALTAFEDRLQREFYATKTHHPERRHLLVVNNPEDTEDCLRFLPGDGPHPEDLDPKSAETIAAYLDTAKDRFEEAWPFELGTIHDVGFFDDHPEHHFGKNRKTEKSGKIIISPDRNQ